MTIFEFLNKLNQQLLQHPSCSGGLAPFTELGSTIYMFPVLIPPPAAAP